MITTWDKIAQENLQNRFMFDQIKTRMAPFHHELLFHYRYGLITKEEANILLTNEEYGLKENER